MLPLVALVLVTAVWGVTFVQIKDALEITGEPMVPPRAPSFAARSDRAAVWAAPRRDAAPPGARQRENTQERRG